MSHARVLVLLNGRSGTLAFSDTKDEPVRIAAGFAAQGVEADVRMVDPRKVPQLLIEAIRQPLDAVIVGGGDGTINCVANALAALPDDRRPALAVLPLGTHNHFSQEMNVPNDLEAAVTAIAQGVARGDGIEPLDIAEVNGHLFLNFSGIGLHPKMVEQREIEHRQIKNVAFLRNLLRKFTKPLAMGLALLRTLGDLPMLRVVLRMGGRPMTRITPAILIGNNIRQIELFGLSEVSSPRRDQLNIYIARTPRLAGLIRLLLGVVTRRLPTMKEFEARSASFIEIRHRRPTLKVSLDGEVMQLRTPLRYSIRRSVLKVVRPTPVEKAEALAARSS